MSQPVPTHAKFTFDTEFFEVVGGGRNVAAVSLPPSAARTSEAKLQQAYAEGQAAGLVEGQQQAQADLARLQQHLQNTLMSLQQATEAREEQLSKILLGFLQGTLEAVLGHASRHYPAELLEHHLRALMQLARTDENLTLRIHPSARGYHEKLQLPQATIIGIPMRIVSESSLGPVDALVEWQQGGVEARLAEHMAAIQELLAAAGATPMQRPDFSNLHPAPPPVAVAEPVAPTMTEAAPAVPPPAPQAPAAPAADDPLAQAERERVARAAALLGDDDLVDALK